MSLLNLEHDDKIPAKINAVLVSKIKKNERLS